MQLFCARYSDRHEVCSRSIWSGRICRAAIPRRQFEFGGQEWPPYNRINQSVLREGLQGLREPVFFPLRFPAGVAELADALDSKSSDRKIVWVRAPPPAPPRSR